MAGDERAADVRDTTLGLERLVFFSDAVMAIAITLLALDIRAPALPPDLAAAQLPAALTAMGPRFTSLVISFVIIGVYWFSHLRSFEFIRSYDARLIGINLLFLLFIVCVPFVTNLLGSYGQASLVYVIYALEVAAIGFSMVGLWAYATHRHRLVDPELDSRLIREHTWRALRPPLVFLISIPFALVNPTLAVVIWILSPTGVFILARVLSRRGAQTVARAKAGRPSR